MPTIIDSNKLFTMMSLDSSDSHIDFLSDFAVTTLFVQEGYIKFSISSKLKNKIITIKKDEGIILTSHLKLQIIENEAKLIAVSSLPNEHKLIEINDVKGKRIETEINDYKLIQNPKKVIKPWGHEFWISWFKNHHVLKKIFMIQGNKCSLQFHRVKNETNYIVSGKAKVLKSIFFDKNIDEESALQSFNKIENIEMNLSNMTIGDYWTIIPGEVHRVYSIDSYTAFEASTPELDDVVRIEDDSNRSSGLIKSEHI